jgi:hypothetical protein
MTAPDSTAATERRHVDVPRLVFGIAIAALVLYLVTFKVHAQNLNDFYREVLPSYRLLDHGHVIAFLRAGPAYVGSLVLRAPLALLASAVSAGNRATYILTAVPSLVAPALLAAWLRRKSQADDEQPRLRSQRARIRPLDLCMLTPAAAFCLGGGHPEDILAAVACIAAVLLAQQGSATAAGFMLGLGLINTSWAVVAVPLVIALMPADQRIRGFAVMAITAGAVLIPVTIIRATASGASGVSGVGSSLGSESIGIFLSPQLLWWFGSHSWVAREGHILLVIVCWLVTAAWWWLRARRDGTSDRNSALLVLALVFFLRAALDPWDNIYYFVPFMFTVMTYEDPAGFPKLSWLYAILLLVIVPLKGPLHPLGANAVAAVFAVFALLTIAYFARRVFFPNRSGARRSYAAVSRSPT